MPHDNRAARAGLVFGREYTIARFRNARIDTALLMWEWVDEPRCKYCGTEIPEAKRLGHCSQRLCRTISRYYHRGGGARRGWMHGSAWPLWEIIGYLNAMTKPGSPLALEFSKRFAHRSTATKAVH